MTHLRLSPASRTFRITLAITGTATAILLAGCERVQTKLDREVDRLCALDGGVNVYETVTLAKENFGANGEVFPQYRHLLPTGGEFGPEFESKLTRTTLVAGDPGLIRTEDSVIRRSDNKVLGTVINYGRVGGDLPTYAEPSSKSCYSIFPHKYSGAYSQIFIQPKTPQ